MGETPKGWNVFFIYGWEGKGRRGNEEQSNSKEKALLEARI